MKRILRITLYILPLIILCVFWELVANSSQEFRFLFASPSLIISKFIEKTLNGELIKYTLITGYESIVGLISGVLIGSVIGFSLLYSQKVSKISKPYIIALSSVPIFGIAPMMIIWFGTGIFMKIAMAFFSTVFVAVFQAYQGGQDVSKDELDFFELNGASNKQKFWKLVFPSSIDWVLQSLRLNSGLAILGAFIGEFIASNKGLGYIILKASGLYDVPYVLAAIICIIILSAIFNFLVSLVEKNKLRIIRSLSLRK